MVMMGGMGGDMMEMDMDGPMEFDIEGPMAMQMLQSLNMEQKNVHPLHHEITLNEHVMRVLRNRFGVNTTQGIQAKSHDPQFQAFMYQVSVHTCSCFQSRAICDDFIHLFFLDTHILLIILLRLKKSIFYTDNI